MSILGTRKIWVPVLGASSTEKENQILKNSGYINLQLHSVNYMSKGNFWQSTFGGRDNIALATTLKYQKGVESIEATSVQDAREVKVNGNYNLGLQRLIATKIPASADAISIDVKMMAIKNDFLQAKFDMLNQPEYQSALQLAPTIVGQVFTVTSLVKKLFTESDPSPQLEASYAGIVSNQAEDHPVEHGKLTAGWLIMLSTNEGNPFTNVDVKKFEIRGDTLFYNNKEVENTYLIFNISFEQLKGNDESSNWSKKYSDALGNLDKIQLTQDSAEIAKILLDSKTMWIEGNALIDADVTYINREKIQIKNLAIASIQEKYRSLVAPTQPIAFLNATDVIKGLTGSSSFHSINIALPETGRFLKSNLNVEPTKPIPKVLLEGLQGNNNIDEILSKDKSNYLNNLGKQNLNFQF